MWILVCWLEEIVFMAEQPEGENTVILSFQASGIHGFISIKAGHICNAVV